MDYKQFFSISNTLLDIKSSMNSLYWMVVLSMMLNVSSLLYVNKTIETACQLGG